jgi:tetratricopeptide (TPR) repeat protein
MEGRYEDAIESFRLAVRIAPSYPEAYYNLAVAYGLTDQRDEALENLEIAADLGYAPAREALASVNSAQP